MIKKSKSSQRNRKQIRNMNMIPKSNNKKRKKYNKNIIVKNTNQKLIILKKIQQYL